MKGWLPQDEELSDNWHTTLTLTIYSTFALPPIFVGARALVTKKMEPCFTDLQGWGIFGRDTLYGARALVAGLTAIDLGCVFVFLAISSLRRTKEKAKFERRAWVLLGCFVLASLALAKSAAHN